MRLRLVLHMLVTVILAVFLFVTLLSLYNTKKSLGDLNIVARQHVPSLILLQTSYNIFNESIIAYNKFENSEYTTELDIINCLKRLNFIFNQLKKKEGINQQYLAEADLLLETLTQHVSIEILSAFSQETLSLKERKEFEIKSSQILQQLLESLKKFTATPTVSPVDNPLAPILLNYSNWLQKTNRTIESYTAQDFSSTANIINLIKECQNTLKNLADLNLQQSQQDNTQEKLLQLIRTLNRFKSAVLLFDDEKQLGVSGANLEEILNNVRQAKINAKNTFQTLNTLILNQISNAQQNIISTNLQIKRNYIESLILGSLVMIVALFLFNRFLVSSINNLVKGAEAFAQGDFKYRLKVGPKSEYLTKLAIAFNAMADRLLEYSSKVEENRQTLEEKVQKRTNALQKATTKAIEANRAKSLFLANMSHEIRTPMSAIIGMTHLAQKTQDIEQQKRFLDTVKQSADNLLSVLNDILDFSKIEAGQLEIDKQPFQLPKLLNDIKSIMSVQALENGVNLKIIIAPQLPDTFIGDDKRIHQILINLVGNAIKFTTKGSVTVRVEPLAKKKGDKLNYSPL